MKKSDLAWIFFFTGICLLAGCNHEKPLNYEWNEEAGYRWSELTVGSGGEPGFISKNSSQTGINFTNNLTREDIAENRHYLNGSGVALGDVNGDGWTDIYFAALSGSNKLYINQGGLRFTDATDSAGVAHEEYYSTGAVFSDVDGDGDLDLLVSSMEQDNVLYFNDGAGKFSRKSGSILSKSRGSHTMTLADIDGDGDLDLYLTNYKEDNVLDLFDARNLTWEETVKESENREDEQKYLLIPPYDEHYTILYKENEPPDRREIGRRDELFINTGGGNFEKVTDPRQRFLDSDGNPKGFEQDWGLTAKFHDINGDGLPDLYVCNDFWTKDRIWINQGEGVFREMDPLKIRNMSFSAMGVDFSDVDRDGSWDMFVTEMLSRTHEGRLRQFIPNDPYPRYNGQYDNQPQYNRNSLYINRGDNTFAEVSWFSGLEASEWSWATRFLDVDLDGYEDLLITTGYSFDVQDLDAQNEWRNELIDRAGMGEDIFIFPTLELSNLVFRNKGDLTFSDESRNWGFGVKDITHGMGVGDLDNDGDLDLVMNRLNGQAAVYQNRSTNSRIAVRLKGKSPNTQAVGAKVELHGGAVHQQDEISAGGDYLSHSDALIVFAADEKNSDHKLTITWPGGNQSVIDSVKANRIYEIDQHSISNVEVENTPVSEETIFTDVSGKINHEHHEKPYDDFWIQPLLPHKLSKQGPGIAWIDFDSDGDDDLFITSGRGGHPAVYENRNADFQLISLGKLTDESPTDQTTVIGWREDQGTRLLTGNANYEPGDIKTPSVLNYFFQDGSVTGGKNVPGIFSTTGAVAAADYDGDGEPDLFVGGRFVPAHYPMDATSRLFKKENGQFVLDEQNSLRFENIGLVTAAVFTDYDQDGDQDLLLSMEWDSIRLFENRDGEFYDISQIVGLDRYKGWWNGIATGDFNNDGRPDIIATNMGTNSSYQTNGDHSLKMHYGDINRDNRIDMIESYYDSTREAYVPRRQLQEYESISDIFLYGISSNEAFANATVNQILGFDADNRLSYKEINTLEHTVFINEGDTFTARPLPDEAQLSAAFYAGTADYDNDGHEDLFLSQNFFQFREKIPRLDAGRGLWLKGDGSGNFEPVRGQASGIEIYGEQRAAALSDFNGDGKVDLAVAQNAAETKLYLNETEKTGLIIRLEGPAENRDGIGSGIRLVYEDGTKGPLREIQAGAGYWSQNSAVQVMGIDGNKVPRQFEVTWFDGLTDTIAVMEDQIRYEINYSVDHR